MMGKKLKIIEKIGINFFWVGEDLGGGSLSQSNPKHTTIVPKKTQRIERISRDGQFRKKRTCTEWFLLLSSLL